jgi:diaminopimelate epimerase
MRRTMRRRFEKMHGLGNDFVIFDAREAPLEMDAGRARALADRRTGIGCDQLIVLEPSEAADVRMRIWNADGGEVEACGNASRCVAMLLGGDCTIETKGGMIRGSAAAGSATVDMGEPRFGWDEIPLAYPLDTAAMPVGWEDLQQPHAVNVGNPHVVFFVEDAAAIDLERLGPAIEADPLFPERVNVNVAEVRIGGMNVDGVRRPGIELRVWERGAGLTQACGTGACATAVAAIRYRNMSSPVDVRLPGGMLTIDWRPGGTIRMTGAAAHAFTGEVAL